MTDEAACRTRRVVITEKEGGGRVGRRKIWMCGLSLRNKSSSGRGGDVSCKRPAGASRQSLMGPHVNLDASDSVNGVMNRRTAKSGLGEIESVCNMGFQPANYLG